MRYLSDLQNVVEWSTAPMAQISQLLERHDASDFELRTQDKLDPDPPAEG